MRAGFVLLASLALASGARTTLRRGTPAVVGSPHDVPVVRSLVGANATSAMCAAAKAKHTPRSPVVAKTLKDYKAQAEECLTWCGSLKKGCIRGCIDDCQASIKAPNCQAYVVDNKECGEACKKMEPVFECLSSVKPDSTQECHSKLSDAKMPDKECPYGKR
eukprot:gnl/TRDRNA2_/TRDRNA2_183538_c0_seq1.p1 gnl/TRDRNA2_/TRDRNA2_183538_c0~~gnl/TRDRNA2_/TRDRNA2_183538_c0_seq1.p1  ORF type:complete len:162 (+),score=29.90 gnl/TRDRNA2_/TRDRNA2_183538_c0_seq1:66-551(+)